MKQIWKERLGKGASYIASIITIITLAMLFGNIMVAAINHIATDKGDTVTLIITVILVVSSVLIFSFISGVISVLIERAIFFLIGATAYEK